MALYKVQSPINSALQGMQNASATTAGMTKKQEVKEPKKSFGGALGSMIAGGSYGLGMADLFTGSEASKAMWSGVKGALSGGAEAGGVGGAAGAIGSTLPETIGGGALALANGGTAGGAAASLAAAESMANAGGAAAVSGAAGAGTTLASTAPEAAGAASAAGPVGWGLLAAGALAGLASYYL